MKKLVIALAVCLSLSTLSLAGPLGQNEAYVIMNDLPLWQDQGGALKWIENLTIGDQVTLLNRAGKFKQDGKEKDFVRIKAPDGQEGWVRTPYVAPKAALAVVKADKAIVYSEPREVRITSKSISYMTIVAVLTDGSTADFAKVQCFDPTQNTSFLDATYIAREDLTTSDTDVNSVVLYTVAAAAKSQEVKKNLLKIIGSKYSGSVFFQNIQDALAAPTP
jgi:hypothetical protein